MCSLLELTLEFCCKNDLHISRSFMILAIKPTVCSIGCLIVLVALTYNSCKKSRPLLSTQRENTQRGKILCFKQILCFRIFLGGISKLKMTFLPPRDQFVAGGFGSVCRVAALFSSGAASGLSSPVSHPFPRLRRRQVSCAQVELWKVTGEKDAERERNLSHKCPKVLGTPVTRAREGEGVD